MKRSFFSLITILIFVAGVKSSAQDTISVSEFGLQPGTRENAVLLVRKALEKCMTKSNPVLLFPKDATISGLNMLQKRCIMSQIQTLFRSAGAPYLLRI